jgi:hypothetical protein
MRLITTVVCAMGGLALTSLDCRPSSARSFEIQINASVSDHSAYTGKHASNSARTSRTNIDIKLSDKRLVVTTNVVGQASPGKPHIFHENERGDCALQFNYPDGSCYDHAIVDDRSIVLLTEFTRENQGAHPFSGGGKTRISILYDLKKRQCDLRSYEYEVHYTRTDGTENGSGHATSSTCTIAGSELPNGSSPAQIDRSAIAGRTECTEAHPEGCLLFHPLKGRGCGLYEVRTLITNSAPFGVSFSYPAADANGGSRASKAIMPKQSSMETCALPNASAMFVRKLR